MFEIIKVKTFQDDEYRIVGDEKHINLEWLPALPFGTTVWELLYFHKLEDDGVMMCMLHLATELKDLATEHRMDNREDDFDRQAEKFCARISYGG